MHRAYRDPAVEEDKKKRKAAVVERFSRQRQPVALTCSACRDSGTLHAVHLRFSTIRLCDVHFVEFSKRASSWIEDMINEGIQHTDQGKLPERLAAELGQS